MLYGIYHEWESYVGDEEFIIKHKDLIGVTDDEWKAKAYIEKWSYPHVYITQFDEPVDGYLSYEKLPMLGSIDHAPDNWTSVVSVW